MASLCVNREPLETQTTDLVRRFLDSVCNLEVDRVMSQLCQDVQLCITNDLCAIGRPKIRKALLRGMSSLISFGCEPALIWIKDSVGVIEADIVCERMDGSRAAFPLTVVLCLRDRLISQIHLSTYEPAILSSFFAQ